MNIQEFTSSALTNIVVDETVIITRPNGVEYTYNCVDPSTFVADFNAAESKGKFLDRSIKSNVLVEIKQ